MAKKTKGRANNGMGSIRQRADGRWEARYSTPDGRQRSVYGKTEKEVSTKLHAELHNVDMGSWQEPSKMTVSQWLDIWLADYQGDNTERTIAKYKSIVDNNIKPIIGNVKLTKLSSLHVRRVVTFLRGKELSQVTINGYIRILNIALERAIEAKLIRENPARDVKVAKGNVKKYHIIERSQFQEFQKAANTTRYANELMFMLYSGLRIGELRGLRWEDIDFDAGTVFVQRQLHPKSLASNQITAPKYNEKRVIHIPQEAIDILKAQRQKQLEQRIAASEWVEDDVSRDLVFRQKNGRAHGEKTISTALKRVGKQMGIPDLHPHDLRHSYAVAAIRAKIDVKTVQHNLGHKTSSMTLDVYVAYTEEAGKEGAQKLSEYLNPTQKQAD